MKSRRRTTLQLVTFTELTVVFAEAFQKADLFLWDASERKVQYLIYQIKKCYFWMDISILSIFYSILLLCGLEVTHTGWLQAEKCFRVKQEVCFSSYTQTITTRHIIRLPLAVLVPSSSCKTRLKTSKHNSIHTIACGPYQSLFCVQH